MKIVQFIWVLLLLLLSGGCALLSDKSGASNDVILKSERSEVGELPLHANTITQLSTFSVLPMELLSSPSLDQQLTLSDQVQHLMFIARNLMEGRGYQYVSLGQNPDMILVVNASHASDINSLNQSRLTKPSKALWQNGWLKRKLATHERTLERMTSKPPSEVASTIRNETNTAAMSYLVEFSLMEGGSGALLWQSPVISSSHFQSHLFQQSQLNMRKAVALIPVASVRRTSLANDDGSLGLGFVVMTPNGYNYSPLITGVIDGRPAQLVGIRPGDFIKAIDGHSVINITTSEVVSKLKGKACTSVALELERQKETVEVVLQRMSRNGLNVVTVASLNALPKLSEEKTLVFHPQFIALAADLNESSMQQLVELIRPIRPEQVAHVQVIAHTDSVPLSGKSARSFYRDNQSLSEYRAQLIAQKIQSILGLNSARVSSKGMGDKQPVASNDTADGRAKNRRVEIHIKNKLVMPAIKQCRSS